MKDIDIDANLGAWFSSRHERTIPDQLDLRDLASIDTRRSVQTAVRNRTADYQFRELNVLPMADGHKVRDFTVPDPLDELTQRVAFGHIAGSVRNATHGDVFSRIDRLPPGWTNPKRSRAHRKRKQRLRGAIRQESTTGTFISDVRSFYPTVPIDALENALREHNPTDRDEKLTIGWIRLWQALGVTGLPIGPEVSSALGTLYLNPLDQELMDHGFVVVRYSDDFVAVDSRHTGFTAIQETTRGALKRLGLEMSPDKTKFFDDPEEAIRYLDHESIQYLADIRSQSMRSRRAAQAAFLGACDQDPLDVALLRYLIGYFTIEDDPIAVASLLTDTRLWSIGPFRIADYLARMIDIGLVPDPERILQDLDPSTGEAAARLRATRARVWGSDVGAVSEGILWSDAANPIVRAEAAAVWALTPRWNLSTAIDMALEHPVHAVRRASTAGRILQPLSRSRIAGLKAIARSESVAAITAEWCLGRT